MVMHSLHFPFLYLSNIWSLVFKLCCSLAFQLHLLNKMSSAHSNQIFVVFLTTQVHHHPGLVLDYISPSMWPTHPLALFCTNKVGNNESLISPVGKQTSLGILQICEQTARSWENKNLNCWSSSDDALWGLNKVDCIWNNIWPIPSRWIWSWLCSNELLHASKHD